MDRFLFNPDCNEQQYMPGVEPPSYKTAIMRFDGGSRGNPGISGCGFIITVSPNTLQEEKITGCLYLGNRQTNNYAEYMGLIEGVKRALANDITTLHIEGDSLLIISQLKGEWKVKSETLEPLHKEATQLLKKFERYTLTFIPRKHNQEADALANLAMDAPHIYA